MSQTTWITDDDPYVVVVADPQTSEIDCYGPYMGRVRACHEAARRRRELDDADLADVVVAVANCALGQPGDPMSPSVEPHRRA